MAIANTATLPTPVYQTTDVTLNGTLSIDLTSVLSNIAMGDNTVMLDFATNDVLAVIAAIGSCILIGIRVGLAIREWRNNN